MPWYFFILENCSCLLILAVNLWIKGIIFKYLWVYSEDVVRNKRLNSLKGNSGNIFRIVSLCTFKWSSETIPSINEQLTVICTLFMQVQRSLFMTHPSRSKKPFPNYIDIIVYKKHNPPYPGTWYGDFT